MSAQVIKCKCGKIYAAFAEPDCYESASWHKDMRKAVKLGHTVELKQKGEWDFERCTCYDSIIPLNPDPNQLSLL